ncbi:MAG: chromosomal replication initiator protein DnaA [Verrucomicrobiales bacterium]
MEREEVLEGGDQVELVTEETGGIWTKACEQLREFVGGDAFDRWFKAASLLSIEDRVATIQLPNATHQLWIESNYMTELYAVLNECSGGVVELRMVVGKPGVTVAAEDSNQGGELDEAREWFPEVVAEQESDALEKRLKRAGLNPSFSFESFVVGSNSQFAHAACEAVGQGKGSGFNPLFIHGGPGLGKTHLMHAAGRQWLGRSASSKVVYMTCEKFTNEFIDAVRKGDLQRFRRKYRTAEVMLIDDVQFIAGKERSQEEFFHTFNTLLDGHCQVVLTSDRPASEIKNLEPRLVSRFECGLTVELQPPGFETRLAILKHKAAEWNVKLDDGIIRLLAERLKSNVRRLEGGLMRVGTYSSLAGERITQEKVEHLLRDLFREENSRQVTIDAIQRLVAEQFDLRLADMTSRRRPASIAVPRQIAMYLSRELTRCSLIEIGEAFGGRDHGTVIHAVKKVKSVMESDRQVKDQVQFIEAELRR